MNIKNDFRKLFVYGLIFIIIGAGFVPSGMTRCISNYKPPRGDFNGHILFAPEFSFKTYLINSTGEIVHVWNSNYIQAFGAYLLENGDLLRCSFPYFNPTFFGGGITGHVEKFDWNGTLLWKFEYSNNQYCLHHDIEPLPNGNILMISWQYKTEAEAMEAGRNPDLWPIIDQIWPDYIIEVEPTGPTSGDIVWEWYVWDHLIQDYDSLKDNYGIVKDHPELIDLNYVRDSPVPGPDWTHFNSIDYNEEFDQIMISVSHFDEIWVIDHSTTTEEAAGHTGGNSGKGGDLLYRWGNPWAYDAGTVSDQKLFGQHDAQWIESGCPGVGNILVFNNGVGRPGPDYSSVDEIVPPVDSNGSYHIIPGSAYGPEEQIWIYAADFYAPYISGAQRIHDGNTLICNGPVGRFYEITPEKVIVWEYVNPYPNPALNDVFKIEYVPPGSSPFDEPNLDCEGSLSWINVKVGETVNGNFQVQNIGGSGSLLNWKIELYPSWGSWSFSPESGENLSPKDGQVTIQVSVIAPDEKNMEFDGILRIENQENPNDFDVIPVILKTQTNRIINTPFKWFLQNHPNLFPILKLLLQRLGLQN